METTAFIGDIRHLVTELNGWKKIESILSFEEDARLREKWGRKEVNAL